MSLPCVALTWMSLPPSDLNGLDSISRYQVALLKGLEHPHLLPLLGYCRSPEAPCLIFPLMRGGSLEHRLFPTESTSVDGLCRLGYFTSAPKPLTWRQRLRVVWQAATALLYMHDLDCVHRDFKVTSHGPHPNYLTLCPHFKVASHDSPCHCPIR